MDLECVVVPVSPSLPDCLLTSSNFSRDPVVAIEWSLDGQILAFASAQEVSLLCAQHLNDLSGAPGWSVFATVRIDK